LSDGVSKGTAKEPLSNIILSVRHVEHQESDEVLDFKYKVGTHE
jgi:hypothetical protein